MVIIEKKLKIIKIYIVMYIYFFYFNGKEENDRKEI